MEGVGSGAVGTAGEATVEVVVGMEVERTARSPRQKTS